MPGTLLALSLALMEFTKEIIFVTVWRDGWSLGTPTRGEHPGAGFYNSDKESIISHDAFEHPQQDTWSSRRETILDKVDELISLHHRLTWSQYELPVDIVIALSYSYGNSSFGFVLMSSHAWIQPLCTHIHSLSCTYTYTQKIIFKGCECAMKTTWKHNFSSKREEPQRNSTVLPNTICSKSLNTAIRLRTCHHDSPRI